MNGKCTRCGGMGYKTMAMVKPDGVILTEQITEETMLCANCRTRAGKENGEALLRKKGKDKETPL